MKVLLRLSVLVVVQSAMQCVSIPTRASYFLKWNTHGAPDQFRQESVGLRALAQAQQDALQPLRIPRVIYTPSEAQSLEDNLPPCLLLEWIETGRPDTTFDVRLGAGLASLHRTSSREFGFTHHTYCGVSLNGQPMAGILGRVLRSATYCSLSEICP